MAVRQSEINRNQSRQRVLRVAALITEGYDYTQACDKLGYRKDTTSRAKQKFIRLGDPEVCNAFSYESKDERYKAMRQKEIRKSTLQSIFNGDEDFKKAVSDRVKRARRGIK